jgi:hypothetical protein
MLYEVRNTQYDAWMQNQEGSRAGPTLTQALAVLGSRTFRDGRASDDVLEALAREVFREVMGEYSAGWRKLGASLNEEQYGSFGGVVEHMAELFDSCREQADRITVKPR